MLTSKGCVKIFRMVGFGPQTLILSPLVLVSNCRFELSDKLNENFIKHLLETHKLVIGEVERVADLRR